MRNSPPLVSQRRRSLRRPSDRHSHYPSLPALKVVPSYLQLVVADCGCSEIGCSGEGCCRWVFDLGTEFDVGFEFELGGDSDMKYDLTGCWGD